MRHARTITILAVITVFSVVGLLAVLRSQQSSMQRRWAPQVAPQPIQGAEVYAVKCGKCHGDAANAPQFAPTLDGAAVRSLPALVTAMWNHAPQMSEMVRTRNVPFPTLSYDETAQLTVYLYLAGAMDRPGDVERGREFLARNRCVQCHSHTNPGLSSNCDTPLDCTQSLWNHAATMNARMEKDGMAWPQFTPESLRNVLAYAQSTHAGKTSAMMGNPDAGWLVFQQKGCIRCHAVQSEGSAVGPTLRPDPEALRDLSHFGASLLNHVPQMRQAVSERGEQWPTFQGHELTDLAVFLYSLNYTQPAGSPAVGKSVFAWRGCSGCHGDDAGGGSAPSLRGRGHTYTAERLATDLWRHAGPMYDKTRSSGKPWPILHEGDVGHLLSFLNTPLE